MLHTYDRIDAARAGRIQVGSGPGLLVLTGKPDEVEVTEGTSWAAHPGEAYVKKYPWVGLAKAGRRSDGFFEVLIPFEKEAPDAHVVPIELNAEGKKVGKGSAEAFLLKLGGSTRVVMRARRAGAYSFSDVVSDAGVVVLNRGDDGTAESFAVTHAKLLKVGDELMFRSSSPCDIEVEYGKGKADIRIRSLKSVGCQIYAPGTRTAVCEGREIECGKAGKMVKLDVEAGENEIVLVMK